jgi:hypothetical protein
LHYLFLPQQDNLKECFYFDQKNLYFVWEGEALEG